MKTEQQTVYVIDDDDAALESMMAVVDAMRVRPIGFSSAEAFLSADREDSTECLLTDCRMESMSGLDLIRYLRVLRDSIPAVLITAYADVPFAVAAMQSGAVTVLEKPCVDEDLVGAIQAALEKDAETRKRRYCERKTSRSMNSLTQNERDVLSLMLEGLPNKSIASRLDIGLRTVEARRHTLFRKMEVDSFSTLIRLLVRAGLAESLYVEEHGPS